MRSAHRSLRSPILTPLRVLPVVGRQIRSLDGLTSAAAQVADVGGDAVVEAQGALALPHNTGPQRVVILRRLSGIADQAGKRLATVTYGPGNALVPPLRHAHDQLAEQLTKVRDGLRKGTAATKAAADLLDGPRHYLVLAANNAEMRSGSGMFLSVGVLETGAGALKLDAFTSAADIDLGPEIPAPPTDPDLEARWGWLHINRNWRNLAMSPRFDAVAPLAAQMWAAGGHGDVDGVLALDPIALKAVLGATGPVDAGGRQVGADDIVQYLLHDQYIEFAGKDDRQSGARKEQLGRVAQATLQALQDRSWSITSLTKELADAARGRHVLAWSKVPAENEAWAAAGIAGALAPHSLLVAVDNRGANKLDHFLDVSVALESDHGGDRREVTLSVHLRNRAPSNFDVPYVLGTGETGVPPGAYKGILSVSLPTGARGGRFEGASELVAFGPDGASNVVAMPFELARGAERTIVLHFDLPPGALRVEPSARVPAVPWRADGHRFDDAAPQTISL
jgi:hypothetical protein